MIVSLDEEQRFRSSYADRAEMLIGAVRLYEMGWSKEALIMERKAQDIESQCKGWYEDLVERAGELSATKIAWMDVRKNRKDGRDH